LKGQEKAIPKSKYIEDNYDSNHTSVWGSWYDIDTSKWGFKCCHQVLRNSYCTGDAGKRAPKLIQASTTSSLSSSSSSSSASSSTSSSFSAYNRSNAPTDSEMEAYYKNKNRDVYV
jgi:pre-mRNA-processing factor SLU7